MRITSRLQVSSSKLQAIRFGILLFLIACDLSPMVCVLLYAQNTKVTVPADVTTETITLVPQGAAPTAVEGRVYYDGNQFRYYNGTQWNPFGGGGGGAGPRTVATRIVAASDSLDKDTKADFICDGTDDQEEINTAINELPVNGGAVYLLEGTYNISGSISFTADDSGKSLIGAGAGTVLRVASGTSSVISVNMNVNHILISQLRIDGNNGGEYGILFNNATTYSKIDKVWVECMKDQGIYLTGGSSNNIITNSHVQSNGMQGILLLNSSNNLVSGNNAQSNDDAGIDINGSSNNTISDNNIYSNIRSGISLSRWSSNNTITGNIIWSSEAGSSGAGDGITIVDNSSNNTISSNIIYRNSREGIYNSGGCNNNIITGNNVSENKDCGIVLCSSQNDVVSGNMFWNNASYALRSSNNTDDALISYNLMYRPTAGDLLYIGFLDKINPPGEGSQRNYLVGNLIFDGTGNYNRICDGCDPDSSPYPLDTRYTDRLKITLERVTDTTSASIQSNSSYVKLGFTSGTVGIDNGKAAGDILVIEGPDSGSVIIADGGNAKLGGNRTLDANNTLSLVWNGTALDCCWEETGYAAN